jgi:hypothetical protein
MRVDRLKAKAVAELEEELAATQRVRAALAAKSPEQLWLDDLDLFEAEYVKFYNEKESARAQVAQESSGAKAKGKAKVPAARKPRAKKETA